MADQLKPFQVVGSKFMGASEGDLYTYELTFNQSLEHTGRIFTAIPDGLNRYRENELKEQDELILSEAERIQEERNKTEQKPTT